MRKNESLILSLETAIGGGSIALIRGVDVVAENDLGTARANVLLTAVESMLEQANAQIRDIGKLAVSLGPGSFTGIRVGLATALGLRRSLNVGTVGVSVFEAIAPKANSDTVLAIVPIGRNMFGCQMFVNAPSWQNSKNRSFVIEEESLRAELARRRPSRVIVVSSGQAKVLDDLDRSGIDFDVVSESRLAGVIGVYASTRDGSNSLEPIYLR